MQPFRCLYNYIINNHANTSTIVFWGSQTSPHCTVHLWNHSLSTEQGWEPRRCVLQFTDTVQLQPGVWPVLATADSWQLSTPYTRNMYAAWKSALLLQLLAKLRDVRKTSCCFVALLLAQQKVRWCSLALKFGPVLGWVYLKFCSIKSRHFFARISI